VIRPTKAGGVEAADEAAAGAAFDASSRESRDAAADDGAGDGGDGGAMEVVMAGDAADDAGVTTLSENKHQATVLTSVCLGWPMRSNSCSTSALA
jgi:hypothetical protein